MKDLKKKAKIKIKEANHSNNRPVATMPHKLRINHTRQ